jgi:CBS domain-containing protein
MRKRTDTPNERTNPTLQRSSERGSNETVRQAMTPDPATVRPSDPLIRAAELMAECDCGALPVVDGTKLVGMITDRDIVTRIVAKKADPGDKRVSDAMSEGGVHTIGQDESLERAFKLMAEHQVRRLPVVDDNGELVGMLAQADLALDSDQDERLGQTVEQISEPDQPRR